MMFESAHHMNYLQFKFYSIFKFTASNATNIGVSCHIVVTSSCHDRCAAFTATYA